MTTLERLATINVTINFSLPLECYVDDDFANMATGELSRLFNALSEERELDFYGVKPMRKERKDLFYAIDAYWTREAMRDLEKYAQHMNEPDFDWDFYSDLYKDAYGVRPH